MYKFIFWFQVLDHYPSTCGKVCVGFHKFNSLAVNLNLWWNQSALSNTLIYGFNSPRPFTYNLDYIKVVLTSWKLFQLQHFGVNSSTVEIELKFFQGKNKTAIWKLEVLSFIRGFFYYAYSLNKCHEKRPKLPHDDAVDLRYSNYFLQIINCVMLCNIKLEKN